MAGRGWGKTRTGAQTVFTWHREGHERINLASRSTGDVTKTMLFGVSGLISTAPPDIRPRYVPSRREVVWPDGRVSLCFSADEPDQARGPASDKVWADELGAWPASTHRNDGNDLWHNLMMGLREGENPQAIVTTTGRRTSRLRELVADPSVLITRGDTWENKANLSKHYLTYMKNRYEGTRFGEQELKGDILADIEGAFWTQTTIDRTRVAEAPPLKRVIMGVDPAVTSGRRADRVGIVVGGEGEDGDCYILADLSKRASPSEWVEIILWAIKEFKVDLIRAESNRGGELIEYCLRLASDQGDPLTCQIDTFNSQQSKADRAEPCSTLHEKGRIHFVGEHKELEAEMTDWDPAVCRWSPNALDALCFVVLAIFPDLDPLDPLFNERVAGTKLITPMAAKVEIRQSIIERLQHISHTERRQGVTQRRSRWK